MFHILNNFKESHVKTFCLTGLSRYTRAPWLVGPKRPPIGCVLGSPGIEAKSADCNLAEQGYVKPHQTHGTMKFPQNKDSPDLQRGNLWEGLSLRIRTNLETRSSSMWTTYLFSLQTRVSILAITCSWSCSEPDFPQWITGEDSKWYLPGLHQISWNVGIQQLITEDYNSQHREGTHLFYSLIVFFTGSHGIYVKFQFIINLSQWRSKNYLTLWTSFIRDLD